jgi:hypothetical protein
MNNVIKSDEKSNFNFSITAPTLAEIIVEFLGNKERLTYKINNNIH